MNADSVISAFTEEQVERLTGITLGQLRYWDRTKFFVPSYAEDNRRVAYSRIYSFKDVAALRTISVLRNQHNVPLQHLRKVGQQLQQLSDDGWVKTTLYVFGKRVIFNDPNTDQLREVVGGQYIVPSIALERVYSDTKRDVANISKRPADKVGRVERSRNVSHNAWVIAGTRIPTAAVRRFKEAGYTTDAILREYPDLTLEDVEAALAHEARSAA